MNLKNAISETLPSQPRTPPLPAARAGDFMRLADSLRVAIELADIAAERLATREGSSEFVLSLRREVSRLRASL